MSLAADNVDCRAGPRSLLTGVSLRIEAGSVHALLGPNGAGKTTLLRVLAGDRAPEAGAVSLNGKPLEHWHERDLARRRAVLTQGDTLRFPLTATEVVALGRLPHAPEQIRDERRIVQAALAMTDSTALADRSYLTLSGGERARLRLARALAQVWGQFEPAAAAPPTYLLLDELAAHLDPAHQHLLFAVVRRFADRGGGVLLTVHDPNLALAYADRVTLLRDGHRVATGVATDTLMPDVLAEVYGTPVERVERANAPPFIVFGAGSAPQRSD